MRDYLEPMFGPTGALIAQFVITLAVLAVIILAVFWLIRTFTGSNVSTTRGGRAPRLSVLDALPVDQKRRLVLVRRDNVEHLILIGGPSDIVVEASIHRASPAQRRAEAAARAAAQRAATEEPPLVPVIPVPESWPEPQPEPARQKAAQPDTREDSPRQAPVRHDYRRETPIAEERQVAVAELVEPPAAIEPAPIYEPVPEAPAPEAAAEPAFETELAAAIEPRPAVEPQRVADVEPVAAEPAPPAPAPAPLRGPMRAARQLTGFFSSPRTRGTADEPAAESVPARRAEPPMRPLTRATPLPLKPAEPTDMAPEDEPQLPAEPGPHMEPARPARPAMPPAPPVAPPTLGEAPYGAPVADPDQPLRFEPIFDIGPENARDPVRPLRQSRETPLASQPFPARLDPHAVEAEAEGTPVPENGEEAPSQRSSAVGDLEKEMARLLGEISGNRRT